MFCVRRLILLWLSFVSGAKCKEVASYFDSKKAFCRLDEERYGQHKLPPMFDPPFGNQRKEDALPRISQQLSAKRTRSLFDLRTTEDSWQASLSCSDRNSH